MIRQEPVMIGSYRLFSVVHDKEVLDAAFVSKELLISFMNACKVSWHLLHNEQATLSRDSWRVTHVWSYVFMCGTSGKYFWTYVVSYRETGRHDRRSSTVAV